MKRFIAAFAFVSLSIFAPIFAKPVQIILDTDCNVTDALALALLHSYESTQKTELLACAVDGFDPHAPVFLSVINEFYGRGNIPILFSKGGKNRNRIFSNFCREVSEQIDEFGAYKYSRRISTNSKLLNPISGLRRILSQADDGSVIYICTGSLANAADFLKSEGDSFSPLNGVELALKKIRFFSVSAGDFSGKHICKEMTPNAAESFAYFVKKSPVPIVFTGAEIGRAIHFSTDLNKENNTPILDALSVWSRLNGLSEVDCSDLVSVLSIAEQSSFDLSEAGVVSPEGIFTPKADGIHRYLLVPNAREIENIVARMRELCSKIEIIKPIEKTP